MTEADQEREDNVLRRMLSTKPKPHKSRREMRKLEKPINERDLG